jgi:hypothetical protein
MYLGNWKRGLRHGDGLKYIYMNSNTKFSSVECLILNLSVVAGVARVCHAPVWDLIGTAENALRKGTHTHTHTHTHKCTFCVCECA